MAGTREVKAGGAWWEIMLRDKLTPELKKVKAKLAAFGAGMKAVGLGLAGFGAGILAPMAAAVRTFMDVSRHAKNIGAAIAGIDPSKADKLIAAWNTFRAVLGSIQFFVGSALAEPLTNLLHIAINLGIKFAKFVKENQGLVVAIAALGAAALLAGTAMVGIGIAVSSAWSAMVGLVAVMTALATPVGLITALVLGGVVAWFAFTDAGKDAFSGIAAAIATNDIPGAFGLVVTSLATMWAQMSEGVVTAWVAVADAVVNVWSAAVKSITNLILDFAAKYGRVMSIFTGGINVEEEIRKSEEMDRKRGLKPQDLLGDAKKGAGASIDSITASMKEFLDTMKTTATNARKAAEGDLHTEAERHRAELRLKLRGAAKFAEEVGAPIGSGSSAGAFGGTAGALLGVGAGGGLKVTDDKGNAILERILKALNGLDVAAEFK